MKLVQIPAEAVPKVWPLAARMLEAAVEHSSGTISLQTEYENVCAGQKQLWMVVDQADGKNVTVAAGITAIMTHPDGLKHANIELFGGTDMKSWFAVKDDFEAWAKSEGCKYVLVWGRKGWVKHLKDFTLVNYILRKDI